MARGSYETHEHDVIVVGIMAAVSLAWLTALIVSVPR